VLAHKECTFAPATANKFINRLTSSKGLGLEFISKNKSKKACEIRICLLSLHPAKYAMFLDKLVR
jgi:hypothetical protein